MKNYGFLIALVALLSGCWKSDKQSSVSDSAKLHVVNVLAKEQYDDAHIKGSVHIDLDDLDAATASWDKQTPVVFYCSDYQCTASSHAARELKNNGFAHVYAYEGGMAEWYQLSKNDSSYKLEGPATESYLTREVPAHESADAEVAVISAQDLKDKMQSAGLL